MNHQEFSLIPSHLYEDIKRYRVVLLCGSGITTEGGPYGKPSFYDTIKEQSGFPPDKPLPAFPDLMEYYCSMLDGGDKRRLIQEAISRIKQFSSPGERRENACQFYSLVAMVPYFDRIVTTNWDPFCESTLNILVPMVEDRDLAFWNDDDRQVLKIHGCITRPYTLVLTPQDLSAGSRKNPLVWNTLKNLMATRLFIIIGYSIRDEDFLSVFQEITMSLGPFKGLTYAFDPNATDEIIREWSEKKVKIIRGTAMGLMNELLDRLRQDDILPPLAHIQLLEKEYERICRIRRAGRSGTGSLSSMYQDGLLHALKEVLSDIALGSRRSNMDHKLREAQRMRELAFSDRDTEKTAYWSGCCEVLQRFNNRITKKIPSYFHPQKQAPSFKNKKA